jgi:hypothetical protein
MKRVFAILAVLLIACPAFAADYVDTSGSKTATAQIKTGSGYFHGITVANAGVYPVTVTILDSITGASTDKKLAPTMVFYTSVSTRYGQYTAAPPKLFYNGLRVIVSSTGTCEYVVDYK